MDSSSAISTIFATEAIAQVRKTHPGIQVELISLSAVQTVAHVAEHRADIGLAYAPAPTGEIKAVRLGQWNCVCVVKNDHPLASKDIIRPGDLVDYPLISYTDQAPTGRGIRQSLIDAGGRCRIATTSNNTPGILSLVARGIGVGIVDTFSCFADNLPNLTSRPLFPAVSNVLTALISNHATASPVTRVFLEHLISAARDMTVPAEQ
jgi:DNA-binding transcriptional LysR family regulator